MTALDVTRVDASRRYEILSELLFSIISVLTPVSVIYGLVVHSFCFLDLGLDFWSYRCLVGCNRTDYVR